MKTMRGNIVSALLLSGLAIITPIESSSAMSLADKTGEHVSLWNALAIHEGVDPSKWTRSEYKLVVRFYSTKVGVFYDGSYEGNLAILNAEMPTSSHENAQENIVRVLELSRYEVDTHRTLFQMQRSTYSIDAQLNPTLTYNIQSWNQTTQIQAQNTQRLRTYVERSTE